MVLSQSKYPGRVLMTSSYKHFVNSISVCQRKLALPCHVSLLTRLLYYLYMHTPSSILFKYVVTGALNSGNFHPTNYSFDLGHIVHAPRFLWVIKLSHGHCHVRGAYMYIYTYIWRMSETRAATKCQPRGCPRYDNQLAPQLGGYSS